MGPGCTYYLDGETLTYEQMRSRLASDKSLFEKYVGESARKTPEMPFQKDWPLALFKRALRDAVASGKEWIGWTSGETQAERYDLSKHIDLVKATVSNVQVSDNAPSHVKNAADTVALDVLDKTGHQVLAKRVRRDQVADYVGKELAQKILSQPPGDEIRYEGLDLKVGGEGMKGFYDVILPKDIGKYVKQWGASVEKGSLDDGIKKYISVDTATGKEFTHGKEATQIWRVSITPEMREGVAKGQAQFMPSNLKEDMTSQASWMEQQAKERGFASATEMVLQDPASFTKLAAQWRMENRRENPDGTLRYMPNKEDLQKHAEAAGSVFQGEANGLLAFKELSTGGNFSLAPGDATPERIAEEAEKVRQSFAGKPEVTEANLDEFLRSQGIELPPTTQMKNGSVTKGPTMQFLPAHHGTPHKVDKFSLEKIGTGEGAQVYGWGLYFAENPKVAEQYATALAKWRIDGKPLEPLSPIEARMRDSTLTEEQALAVSTISALRAGESYFQAAEALRRAAEYMEPGKERDKYEKAIEWINDEDFGARFDRTGNQYTVDIDAPPDAFLDWDKPLSEQSEKVKAALRASQIADDIAEYLDREPGRPYITGADVYKMFAAEYEQHAFQSRGNGNERNASEDIRELGIPGIRYLDQGSRTPKLQVIKFGDKFAVTDNFGVAKLGEFEKREEAEAFAKKNEKQTHNYVIFDEGIIRITHENGEPVTAAERKEALGEEQGGKAFMPENQKLTSAGTSQRQTPATFSMGILKRGTRNADIGGGKYDDGTKLLAKQGVKNILIDPFNRSEEWNKAKQAEIDAEPTDTATVNNVLNVIAEESAREDVIKQAAKAIKRDGTAYFLIHEGSTGNGKKAGDGIGRQTKGDSWQNYRKAETYIPEIKKHFRNVERKGTLLIASEPIRAPKAKEAARERIRQRSLAPVNG